MEEKKYVVEIPEEKYNPNVSGDFRKNFIERWTEETENLKKHNRYSIRLSGNGKFGAIKTASGVCRFSNVKEVKYV